ncbi:TRAP transporter small permease subunit [Dichotomicrobium thermohalophilum]|uniref:TRAP transporter small permease protein n=1 Tax=Dichotomicrobium thermohalophilum TaxID=933063 RepID=A0A397Q544_9HYPH|nr:TRAP transporter small permease subunit [Dichotomicrobium thermohalophilum]RIA55539.1 TRAP-type mannitol/chloroaromatic compound transport system permease small subunit [Dichotomicrobium thermohalophilum]
MQTLYRIANAIDALNTRVGNVIAWAAFLMVLIQFGVVILRYVFAFSNTALSESIWYLHGLLFMIGAGYTLLYDGHVRVDVFYREASQRYKAWVDLLGSVVFIIPLCILTIWLSWGYVINAWRVLEGSTELAGLPLIFLYKTVIWVFAAFVGLQALSTGIKAFLFLMGRWPRYSPGPMSWDQPGAAEQS